ncbi:hypothetical protein GCM10010116_24230 [Microbispora rosea subsp. aerata]|nr:hypothetical protein [Microbispora rosea]GGO12064.1 hypothetical protein GCM10010116_24230 [Microbispora rosea subsp. aerata]GIH55648.1 hypothetical protein Mro02_25620 [Microbispora rosea subsp. aerata]GLJ86054.1 hypothetical protein GCM10017588_47870 [Microbispora rosea subsp. aerata]
MTDRRSRASALALATVAALGVVATAVSPVQAQPLVLVQCQGTETVAYNPGVIFQPREFEITTAGRFTSCLGGGEVTSGSYDERFTIVAGCNDLLDNFESTRTITWNTAQASVIEGTGSSTAVAGQVITTFTGTITSGPFTGRSAVQTITLPQLGLLKCLTTGLTGTTGITTLTII